MKDLFVSKKFWVSLIAVILMILQKAAFPELNVEEALAVISPLLAYVIGQGIADHGKEKAKLDKK